MDGLLGYVVLLLDGLSATFVGVTVMVALEGSPGLSGLLPSIPTHVQTPHALVSHCNSNCATEMQRYTAYSPTSTLYVI
jgi:hypothetical protein